MTNRNPSNAVDTAKTKDRLVHFRSLLANLNDVEYEAVADVAAVAVANADDNEVNASMMVVVMLDLSVAIALESFAWNFVAVAMDDAVSGCHSNWLNWYCHYFCDALYRLFYRVLSNFQW